MERFGGKLSWERLEGKQGCRIAYITTGGYKSDESKWPAIQDAMIDAMIRLEKALAPYRVRDTSAGVFVVTFSFGRPLMSISVACPTCGGKLKVLDKYAGQRVKCPDCGKPLDVPEVPPEEVVMEFVTTKPAAPRERADDYDDDDYDNDRPQQGLRQARRQGFPLWALALIIPTGVAFLWGVALIGYIAYRNSAQSAVDKGDSSQPVKDRGADAPLANGNPVMPHAAVGDGRPNSDISREGQAAGKFLPDAESPDEKDPLQSQLDRLAQRAKQVGAKNRQRSEEKPTGKEKPPENRKAEEEKPLALEDALNEVARLQRRENSVLAAAGLTSRFLIPGGRIPDPYARLRSQLIDLEKEWKELCGRTVAGTVYFRGAELARTGEFGRWNVYVQMRLPKTRPTFAVILPADKREFLQELKVGQKLQFVGQLPRTIPIAQGFTFQEVDLSELDGEPGQDKKRPPR
jgi:hypothetical protein